MRSEQEITNKLALIEKEMERQIEDKKLLTEPKAIEIIDELIEELRMKKATLQWVLTK